MTRNFCRKNYLSSKVNIRKKPGKSESAQPIPKDVTQTSTFVPFNIIVRGPMNKSVKN